MSLLHQKYFPMGRTPSSVCHLVIRKATQLLRLNLLALGVVVVFIFVSLQKTRSKILSIQRLMPNGRNRIPNYLKTLYGVKSLLHYK